MPFEITAELVAQLHNCGNDPRRICELLRLQPEDLDRLAQATHLSSDEQEAINQLRAALPTDLSSPRFGSGINCQMLVDLCFDYIDGVLLVEERQAFVRHVSQCDDCLIFFETYRRTPELTRSALASETPAIKPGLTIRDFLRAMKRT